MLVQSYLHPCTPLKTSRICLFFPAVRTAERALGWTFWQPITSIGLQLLAIGLVTATKFPDA